MAEIRVKFDDKGANMTPLQRFKIAAKLGIPDQVPVMPFATGHYIAWFAGIDEKDYWWDPVKKFKAQLKLQDRFPDVMLYPGIWPDFSIAVEVSSLGCRIEWPQHASPQVREHITDIDTLEPPDPWKDGLMPKALETYQYMLENMSFRYKEQYEYLDGWAISLGPIDMAGLCIGYDALFRNFYLHPEKIHKLVEITTETVIRYIRAQEKIGGRLKRYEVADDAIGLISPQHFREFALPYLKKIFATFSYAIGIFHCDANTSHLLDDIPNIGMDVFNFGPEVNLQEIKSKIGKKICLLGNVPTIDIDDILPSSTLLRGTPEEVDEVCRYQVKVGKPNGGYILTSGSGMARGTPEQNIETMIRAAVKYGKY